MPMPAASADAPALRISVRRETPVLSIIEVLPRFFGGGDPLAGLGYGDYGRAALRETQVGGKACRNGGHDWEQCMNLGIKNLKVLVTAGAGGIGLETARSFVAEGAKVHVCDVDKKALNAMAKSDPTITRSTCDVADRKQVARLFKEALHALGGLDVLVNNAGIAGPTGKVDEIAPEDWDRCLAVDITGQFNCARLAVPHLRQSKNASIVNLSSAAGRLGFPLRTPYSAAKWAVVGFSKSLAAELGPEGIRVNAIQPGVVAGERIDRVMENKARARGITPAAMLEEALSVVSMRTTVTPQQIADAIVFICSTRGRTISGQAISICGDTQMLP